jgi:hypothetical protein
MKKILLEKEIIRLLFLLAGKNRDLLNIDIRFTKKLLALSLFKRLKEIKEEIKYE